METIENNKKSVKSLGAHLEGSKFNWAIAKNYSKICIILGTICIVFIVAGCYFSILCILAEYSEDKILIKTGRILINKKIPKSPRNQTSSI